MGFVELFSKYMTQVDYDSSSILVPRGDILLKYKGSIISRIYIYDSGRCCMVTSQRSVVFNPDEDLPEHLGVEVFRLSKIG